MKGSRTLRWGFLLLGLATALAGGGRTENRAERSRSVMQAVEASPAQEKAALPGFRLLHSFAGGVNDGAKPTGSLILSGSSLYGMTGQGGGSDLGTVFKMQTSGTGFALLHEFAGYANNDAENPRNSLILSNSTLYGIACAGTIFKIQDDGSGYTKIFEYCWSGYEGSGCLIDSLKISGSTLIGMRQNRSEWGVDADVFQIKTDGTDNTTLYNWGYDRNALGVDGSLIISGSTIYGKIVSGDIYYNEGVDGKIFKMPTDGSDYSELLAMNGTDGYIPAGSLILSGSTLYGMTWNDGVNRKGSIFKIQTDGSDFTILHKFKGGSGDGWVYPEGSLLIAGSTLYGMTAEGGKNNKGTIFKIQTNGRGFTLIHSFAGGSSDGAHPVGPLVLSGTTLYGMTKEGGASNKGVVFSLNEPSIASISVVSPNGGEKWTEGDTHNITWKSTGTFPRINIDYSTNKGDDWSPVVTNTSNNGSSAWTVPNTPSLTCLVRISDAADANINDISDSVFSILMDLDLVAERHEVRAFSVLRQYGLIHFLGEDANVLVAQYRIMRRKGNEEFTLLRTVAPSELQDNQFQMQDKYLEKGISYTYRVEAYDAAGQLIGISPEKII